MLDLAAAFIALTAFFTYLNYRFLRLPPTIGVMAVALVLSLLAYGLAWLGYPVLETEIGQIVRQLDFSEILMTWFLPALLFAGALHVDLADLRSYKWPIGLMATAGVLLSTFIIGGVMYYALAWFGWPTDLIYCLLLGALISPTDPIAVMGILKTSGAPQPLQTTIVGESLFNDGVAVVVFSIMLTVLAEGTVPTAGKIGLLFVEEAIGGALLGLALGYLMAFLAGHVEEYQPTVMLTLALVLGGSAVATHLHLSAPIAMVVAGLIVGNVARKRSMTEEERRYVDGFWELIDEILNALLFALIGLEILILPFDWLHFAAGVLLALVVLGSRVLTLAPPVLLLRSRSRGAEQVSKGTVRILTWGGLRGGISVALALSLPAGESRDLLLTLTYVVVLTSILLQGLTIGKLVKSLYGDCPADQPPGH
ncbi:cation:proton antiporter [Stutzerimonas urumqiensis]|uniref:cation:proton antiporter n=1 Tax=Stutzerimonas urumqiensis TaxID=638269 RepID=UPI000EB1F852|nr:sodium:proton antiporter [Stutzerimonas urumqiensis]